MLSAMHIEQYRVQGFLYPLRILSEEEATAALQALRKAEADYGGTLHGRLDRMPYHLFGWADSLARNPLILDAVESLLGPDIVCWAGQFFCKEHGDGSYVSWHQDGIYLGPGGRHILTVWLALTPSGPMNGGLRVIPRSHARLVPHSDTFAEKNLLSRGQEVVQRPDEEAAVDISLQPGEISIHDGQLVHGSNRNLSERPRVGFAIRYAPSHAASELAGSWKDAIFVRGAGPTDIS